MKISNMWQELNKKLDALTLDDNFNYLNSATINEMMIAPYYVNCDVCLNEIKLLKTIFKDIDNISVVEVGAGYGNFCAILHTELYIKEYTILDTPSMLRLSKHYLNFCDIKVNFVSDLEKIKNKKFDLFVSNICLSELPKDYMVEVLNTLLTNCKYMFIIDSDNKDVEFYNDFIETLKPYFDIIMEEKCDVCLQKNHNVYYGKKYDPLLQT